MRLPSALPAAAWRLRGLWRRKLIAGMQGTPETGRFVEAILPPALPLNGGSDLPSLPSTEIPSLPMGIWPAAPSVGEPNRPGQAPAFCHRHSTLRIAAHSLFTLQIPYNNYPEILLSRKISKLQSEPPSAYLRHQVQPYLRAQSTCRCTTSVLHGRQV